MVCFEDYGGGNNEDSSKKINWLNWDQMSLFKAEGGMAFRTIKSFNLALLAKQGWKLIIQPSFLVSCLLKEKYFLKIDFL